jgi:hypothetical protein
MWPTSAVAAVPIVERADEVSKSFSADEDDRAKAGAHLQVGEPTVEPETDEGKSDPGIAAGKGLWESRSGEIQQRDFLSASKFGKTRGIPTFPQPRRRRDSSIGYISNGATTPLRLHS